MTEIDAARPAPLSRVWSGSKIVAEDLDGPDLADVLELHSDAFAWWVLSRRPEEVAQELRDVAVPLDLDVVAIADLVAEDNRAKFEQLGHSRLVIANAVTLDEESARLTVQPTSMVVTDRALICLVGEGTGGPGSHGRLNLCRALAREQPALSAGGVTQALLLVLGGLVQGYEDVVHWLENSSEELTQGLFEERPLNRSEHQRVLRMRRVLSDLLKVLEPMRGVVADVADSCAGGNGDAARRWRALTERLQRTALSAVALRESFAFILDTSLALSSVANNEVMKRLAGWAAVIAVPTLISSFAGMNVSFPWSGTVAGFWLSSLVMVVAVVAILLLLRSRRWL